MRRFITTNVMLLLMMTVYLKSGFGFIISNPVPITIDSFTPPISPERTFFQLQSYNLDSDFDVKPASNPGFDPAVNLNQNRTETEWQEMARNNVYVMTRVWALLQITNTSFLFQYAFNQKDDGSTVFDRDLSPVETLSAVLNEKASDDFLRRVLIDAEMRGVFPDGGAVQLYTGLSQFFKRELPLYNGGQSLPVSQSAFDRLAKMIETFGETGESSAEATRSVWVDILGLLAQTKDVLVETKIGPVVNGFLFNRDRYHLFREQKEK